jgi:hypothetical protein
MNDFSAPAGGTSLDSGSSSAPAGPAVNHVWHGPTGLNVARNLTASHTLDWWQHLARTNAFGDQSLQPSDGFTKLNETLLCQMYSYYGSLHSKNPTKFIWVGLAKMAGACVVSGLRMAAAVSRFSGPEQDADSCMLIDTAKKLFEDVAWQFEAYAGAGIGDLRALLPDYDASNLIPNGQAFPSLPAWELIEKGNAAQGGVGIAEREQKVFIQNGFNSVETNELTGRAGAITQCPHPYGRSFSVVEPTGSIQVKDDRFDWITKDMWPTWVALPPAERGRLVDLPFEAMIARNFTLTGPLLPQFLPPGDAGEDDD